MYYNRGMNRIVLAILAIIIAIAAIVAAIFALQNPFAGNAASESTQAKIQSAFQRNSPTPARSPTPTHMPISPEGWETYTDPVHGFSIQYPPNYYVAGSLPLPTHKTTPSYRVISIEPTELLENKEPIGATYAVIIAVDENTSKLTFSNPRTVFGKGPYLKYNSQLIGAKPVDKTSLGGVEAYRVNGCCGTTVRVEADLLAIREGRIYEVTISPRKLEGDRDVNKQVVEDIIATFTFTETLPIAGER